MIVPTIAPTWRYAARAENSSLAPQAASARSAIPIAVSAAWLLAPTVRQRTSYTTHATTSPATLSAIASHSSSPATAGSTSRVSASK